MTTESDFQTALDADPTDWQTRLVFADWLEEQGDSRVAGYRRMGELRVSVIKYQSIPIDKSGRWGWCVGKLCVGTEWETKYPKINKDWFEQIRKYNTAPNWQSMFWCYFTSRQEGDDALAIEYRPELA